MFDLCAPATHKKSIEIRSLKVYSINADICMSFDQNLCLQGNYTQSYNLLFCENSGLGCW